MADLDKISADLQAGKADDVAKGVRQALDGGVAPREILEKGMLAAMGVVGTKFKAGELYVPHVLVAARAMHAGMKILKPKLVEAGVEPVGKVIVGTVAGDLHDIGKNLVIMMLQGGGFEVVDMGVDVKQEKFAEAVKEQQAGVLALSALLTTTMPMMKQVIEHLQSEGLRDKVKIMIGGAPVTEQFAKEIGADGYAADAAGAVDVAKNLIAK